MKRPMSKKLWPLAVTKFFTAFNDNAFRFVAMFVAMGIIRAKAGSQEAAEPRQAALVALASMIFMLPFVLFPTVTGWLADRYSKRKVLVGAKAAEIFVMTLGLLSFVFIGRLGFVPLLTVVFLMSFQSTFFSPAFFGILPETFDESELSNANGIAELISFLGMILGTGAGALTQKIPDAYYANPSPKVGILVGIPFIIVAIIGTVTSLYIHDPKGPTTDEKFGLQLITNYFRNFKYVFINRPIWLCVLGHAFFFSLGCLITTSLLNYGTNILKVDNAQTSGLTLAVAIGIGVGCFIAGKVSHENVEFGLVPIGAMGMCVFFINLILAQAYLHALISCAALGFFGGFFVLPLTVYIQQKAPAAVRGKVLAQTNAVSFIGMLLVSVAMLVATGGVTGEVGPDAGFWTAVRSNFMTFDTRQLYMGAAIFVFLGSAYAFWLLPDFVFRFAGLILTRFVYDIRVIGKEHLPSAGPVLLLPNHVSFVDGLVLSAASSRPIHFIIDDTYFKIWWVRPLARWLHLLPVPSGTSTAALRAAIDGGQEVLKRGDVLCIFPEGRLTNNGKMREFKRGYAKMIPADLDVPVVPVHIGLLWGSIFSRFYGRIKPRLPRQLPYPVNVAFGRPLPADVTPWAARQAIMELNADTESEPAPGERVFPERVIRMAHRHPFAKLFCDTSGAEMSYMQLLTKAYAVAGVIRRDAGEDETHIGLMLPNCAAGAVAGLATMLADRIPVFLNYTAGAENIDFATRKYGIKRVYSSKAFLEKAKLEMRDDYIFLEDIAPTISGGDRFRAAVAALLPASWACRRYFPKTATAVFSTATVLFSSGSSGRPKGVVLTHHNLNANRNAVLRALGLDRRNVLMAVLPFFHSFGFMGTLWAPLSWGIKTVWHPNPLDAEAIGAAAGEHRATMIFATPTFLRAFMRKCTPEQFSNMRYVITGAEKLQQDVARKFYQKFGVMPIEGYGTTELAPVVSVNVPEDLQDVGQCVGREGSIGQPIPGVVAKTADPVSLEDLEDGREGVLLIRGPNVMKEYLDDAERTKEVLQDGWYNTGDMARIDPDGYMFITGRLSRFSKIGGEMVPHIVVEQELQNVVDSNEPKFIVTAVEDKTRGERLIILHLPLDREPAEVVAALRDRGLPNLWVPKPKDFHEIDEIPLLGSGKLDLRRVQEIAAARSGTGSSAAQQ